MWKGINSPFPYCHLSPATDLTLDLIQSWLRALVHSTMVAGNGFHLPEKESIAPNQHSWPETAVQMGVKHCRKGKVNSTLTAQHIGKPNRKHTTDGDPYGAGEQSSKHAKPDARSATANARACAAREQPAPKVPLPLSQPLPMPLPPSTLLPLPATQPLPTLFPPPMLLPLPLSQPMLFPPVPHSLHFSRRIYPIIIIITTCLPLSPNRLIPLLREPLRITPYQLIHSHHSSLDNVFVFRTK